MSADLKERELNGTERLEARPAQLLYLLRKSEKRALSCWIGRRACLPMPLLMRLELRCLAGNDPTGSRGVRLSG